MHLHWVRKVPELNITNKVHEFLFIMYNVQKKYTKARPAWLCSTGYQGPPIDLHYSCSSNQHRCRHKSLHARACRGPTYDGRVCLLTGTPMANILLLSTTSGPCADRLASVACLGSNTCVERIKIHF